MMSDIYKECTLSKRKGNLIVRLWEVYQENAKGEKVCVKVGNRAGTPSSVR